MNYGLETATYFCSSQILIYLRSPIKNAMSGMTCPHPHGNYTNRVVLKVSGPLAMLTFTEARTLFFGKGP
jgi:hypothetical protein